MMINIVVFACMVACAAGEALKQSTISLYLDPASDAGRSCVKRIGSIVETFTVRPDSLVYIDVLYIGHGQRVKDQLCVRKVLGKRPANATPAEGLNYYFNLKKARWWKFLMCQAIDAGNDCFGDEIFPDRATSAEIRECANTMKDTDPLIVDSNEVAEHYEATSGCLVRFGSPSEDENEDIWVSGATCAVDNTGQWVTDTVKGMKECVKFWADGDDIEHPQKPKEGPDTFTITYYVRQKCQMLNPDDKAMTVSKCRGKDIAV